MQVDKKYPIVRARRVSTKFGDTVLLTLQDSAFHLVKVFLPQRYAEVFSDDDITSINDKTATLSIVYKGVCVSTKSHLLEIE